MDLPVKFPGAQIVAPGIQPSTHCPRMKDKGVFHQHDVRIFGKIDMSEVIEWA